MSTIDIKLEGQDNYFVQESFKFIRTNIQFCGADIKTIAITSCNENEGKSTVALHIAKSFAELGKKVLFIDADMRKSVLAGRNFKMNVSAGLSEFLSGQVKDAHSFLHKTTVENLHFILAGVYPPNPAELLSSKNFDSLLNVSRNSFDYVIIDTPPLGAVADAAIIASKCDGTIMVFGSDEINRKEAQEVISRLRLSGTKLLGAIRNNATTKSGSAYGKKAYYKHKSSNVKKVTEEDDESWKRLFPSDSDR